MKFFTELPIPVCGLMLGLAGLGILLKNFTFPFQSVVTVVCGILSACLLVLVLLKLVLAFGSVRAALQEIIPASVAGTFPMALMLYGVYLHFAPLWYAAVILHAVLIIWFTVKFVPHLKLPQVFPSFFIVYVGIVLCSITCSVFEAYLLGQIVFWFGLVMVLILAAALIVRYLKVPVPDPAKPLFCIFIAPTGIILAGYTGAFDAVPEICMVLFIISLAVLALVLCKLPSLMKLPFYPSYAAFTFPFVICSLGATMCFAVTGLEWVFVISVCETVFTVCLVCYAFIRYMMFFTKLVRVSVPQKN